jgi:hypothetical protein
MAWRCMGEWRYRSTYCSWPHKPLRYCSILLWLFKENTKIKTTQHLWWGDLAVRWIDIGRGNWSTRRKPAPVPLCPPQIPHYFTWDWNGSKDPTTGYRAGTYESCPRCSSSVLILSESRDRTVGRATGYRLDGRGIGVRIPAQARFFSSPSRPDRIWGPNTTSCPMGRGVKRPGRGVDHSPLYSAEIKNTWMYRSSSPCVFMT